MQVAETVDAIRRAVRKGRAVLERPAFVAKPGYGDGDTDRTIELFERQIDLGTMRPRAGIGDIKMIASRFRLEPGRAVRRHAVAESAVETLEIAGLANFRRRFFITPFAVN